MTDEPLGSHVLELQLADVVEETSDARSLVFSVPDGADIPAERLRYAPGQFLTLRVPSDRTGSVARCYSLCSSPFIGDPMTVTVKRTDGGYASNWLCDHAHAGMKIHVLAPSGTFVPKTLDTDFLLLGAGSGITPMMSICKSALAEGSGKVVLGLRQSGRELGDFRRLPARFGGQVPRPAHRRALAGFRAGAAECGGAGRVGSAVRRPRRLHLRSGTVHGGGRGGIEEPRGRAHPHRGVQVAGIGPVRRCRHRGGRQRRGPRHGDRHARRRDPRDSMAAQRQVARCAARQGPRRAVLLP